jgi:hypothetical protein
MESDFQNIAARRFHPIDTAERKRSRRTRVILESENVGDLTG